MEPRRRLPLVIRILHGSPLRRAMQSSRESGLAALSRSTKLLACFENSSVFGAPAKKIPQSGQSDLAPRRVSRLQYVVLFSCLATKQPRSFVRSLARSFAAVTSAALRSRPFSAAKRRITTRSLTVRKFLAPTESCFRRETPPARRSGRFRSRE